ncbi:hypothetical protein WELLINGTON_238 [Erwinia phage Wellington]|jgi:hypothetical protein|uniref:Uncharacterized protein n=1 Tax=Erwinia phage Wellington TaxID=2267653 RepID=A0A345BLP3_9CAUD|nr:hypothetical protein HOT70_gp063 [Erwinia phage Wellington]AXF51364.1 hypothetical protein WELLINGTON_238 [Erwinia phage Wellington]
MQVILNMALGEQANQISELMVDLRKDLNFELHDIISKYERSLREDTDKVHHVVDAPKIVDELTALIVDQAKDVLQKTFTIGINGWDTVDELALRVEEAFTKGVTDLESYVHLNAHETFVACGNSGERTLTFQMESLHDLFGATDTMKVEGIVMKAKEKVGILARQEMETLLSKLQLYKLTPEQVDGVHEMGRGEMTVSRF